MADRYGRLLLIGRYPYATSAARAFLKELNQQGVRSPNPARLTPERSLDSIRCHILQRAHDMGRPHQALPWSPEEYLLVDEHVRGILHGRFSDTRQAGIACLKKIAQLHRAHPDVWGASSPRTLLGVVWRVAQRMRTLGAIRGDSRWTLPERRILDRYSRAALKGEYRFLSMARVACWRELFQLHQKLMRKVGFGQVVPARSQTSVAAQLRLRAFALGRPRRGLDWTPQEMRILMKWARKYQVARRHWHSLNYADAAGAARRELKLKGFSRTQTGVCAKLQSAVRGRWGRYQAQGE